MRIMLLGYVIVYGALILLGASAPTPKPQATQVPEIHIQICLPAMSPACHWQDYTGELPLVLGDVGPLGKAFVFRADHPQYGEVLMSIEIDELICKWTYDFGRMWICNF